MKWWEKTVEYSFVYLAAKNNIFNLLIPLDGNVESIGDTVLGKDSEFYIIEFKKELSDLSGEYKKYAEGEEGYLTASKEMRNDPSSRSHFLVGGKFVENQAYLSIEARRYFEVDEIPITDVSSIFTNGMNRGQLSEYTKKITLLKKEESAEGSGGSGAFTYENVLAVSASKKKATLLPLHYFKAPSPKLELTQKKEFKPSTPSPF